MRTKLSKLLARKNDHKYTNTDNSINTCKKKKKKISAISRFILPNNIRSIIRSALLTSDKFSTSSKDDNSSEEVDDDDEEEENTTVSSPESLEKGKIVFPVDKQQGAAETFSVLLIKKLQRATSDNLARVRSFRSDSFRKARSIIGKEMDKTEAEKTEEIREELCKKRILMGRKCRPLHVSGALHYDDDGILLPEEILSPQH